jgi:hypothetical protein
MGRSNGMFGASTLAGPLFLSFEALGKDKRNSPRQVFPDAGKEAQQNPH